MAQGCQVTESSFILGAFLQATKVGQKRRRDSDVDELDFYEDGQARKKSRIGWPAQQWITIYNKHPPMKQRYTSPSSRQAVLAVRCLHIADIF